MVYHYFGDGLHVKLKWSSWWPPFATAIMWFGAIVVRKQSNGTKVIPSDRVLHHELIHIAQAKECGGYVWYYFVYLWQWLCVGFRYNKIPFEKEAYANDKDFYYLETRLKKAWKKYK